MSDMDERIERAVVERIERSLFATTTAQAEPPSALNYDMLRALMATPRLPPPPRIVYTQYALEDSTERLFPASKHRSARVRKKLLKRHGGEFRKRPVIWEVGGTIYAHPAHRSRLDAHLKGLETDAKVEG